jgi:hypothetical protein
MSEINVAFWNLQNLFDTTASEIATDLGYTPEKGWTQAVFEQKLANLADVINLMFDEEKPDLLGLCEIENLGLVEQLRDAIDGDDYEIAHDDSPDIRGIDCSLVYSSDIFELAGEPQGHLVHLRYPTRDIFEVPLRVKENAALVTVFVNHWPSRRRGQFETEPFRLTVASHCGKLVDRLLKVTRSEFLNLPDTEASLDDLNRRWNSNVLLMGDFNDEPYNRSVLDFLRASSGEDNLEELIKEAQGPGVLPSAEAYLKRPAYLFDCMWPLLGLPDRGTYYYSYSTNTMNMLDQFITSRGLYYGSQGLNMNLESVEIFRPSIMAPGKKKRPKQFRFNKDGIQENGYSDHFPIQAVIETL